MHRDDYGNICLVVHGLIQVVFSHHGELFRYQAHQKKEQSDHEGKQKADADAPACQHQRNTPDKARSNTGQGNRKEDFHGVEQQDDAQDFFHGIHGRHGVDGAFSRGPVIDGDRRFQYQVSLADKNKGNDIAESHGVGAEPDIFLGQSGVVYFHAGVNVVHIEGHENFSDGPYYSVN